MKRVFTFRNLFNVWHNKRILSASAFSLLPSMCCVSFSCKLFYFARLSMLFWVKYTTVLIHAKASAILLLIVFVPLGQMLTKWRNQTVSLWKDSPCRPLKVPPGTPGVHEPHFENHCGRKRLAQSEVICRQVWGRPFLGSWRPET